MPVSSWDGAVNPTGNNEHDVVPPCKRPSNAEPGSMCPDVEPKSFCCFYFFPQQLQSRVGTVNDLYIFCLNSYCCFVCKHDRLARKRECKRAFAASFLQADRRVIALQQHACVTVFDICRGKEHSVPVLHPADHRPPPAVSKHTNISAELFVDRPVCAPSRSHPDSV